MKKRVKKKKISAKKIIIHSIAGIIFLALIISLIILINNSNNNGNPEINKKEALAKCLTEKGAILYGMSWCPHCQNQKKEFGDAAQFLPYIECSDPANTQKCSDASVNGIPDWRINGKQYLGEQTLEDLAENSGCPY